MNRQRYLPFLALTLLALPAQASSTRTPARVAVSSAEAGLLRGLPNVELSKLRGGRNRASVALDADASRTLREAESRSVGLADLRAGELTEKEWTWVAIGAAVILIIILI